MKILIVLPAHNEEKIIEKNVSKVINFIKNQKHHEWHLMVAENGSKDRTPNLLKKISKKYSSRLFSFKCLPARSKSDAIKMAWFSRNADIYSYMDADLSTDIAHIPELIQGIQQGYDIIVGSRSLKASKVKRSMKRNFISYSYNIISRILFSLDIKDLQCGFKAVSKKTLNSIIKKTKYLTEGFMDTEMLILARHKGLKIKEIPVRWVDDRKSKFNFFLVAVRFIGNLLKVKRDIILKRYKI